MSADRDILVEKSLQIDRWAPSWNGVGQFFAFVGVVQLRLTLCLLERGENEYLER